MTKAFRNTAASTNDANAVRIPRNSAPHFPAMAAGVDDAVTVTSKVLLHVDQHHGQVSQQLADFFDRKRSLFVRLFPTQLDRVLQDSQLNQARTDADLNERLLKLACDAKYAACVEVADAWVKSLRIGIREKFVTFITERYASLKATIEQRRVEFGEHIRERYRVLDTYQSMPALATKYAESIDREIDQYFLWLDQLLENFRAIVDEKLGDYDRPALPQG